MALISLEISIDDEKVDEVVDCFVRQHGWAETKRHRRVDGDGNIIVDQIPNPESKDAAFLRLLVEYIRSNYCGHKATKAAALATKQSQEEAEAVAISIT